MNPTITSLTPNDIAALVRAKVKRAIGAPYFKEEETEDTKMIALICTVSGLWPKCQRKRSLRLNILMALTGKPIQSQREIKKHETKALLEVLNNVDNQKCFTTGRGDLQTAVEGAYFGRAWEFPHTRPAKS